MPTISTRWKPVYSNVLVLYLKGNAVTHIAKELHMNPATVHAVINREDFQIKFLEHRRNSLDAAQSHLKEHVLEAAEKICTLARDGKGHQRLQFDAAKEILYMVGLKPVEIVETRSREYTPEEIQSSLAVTREIEQINDRLTKTSSRFVITKRTGAPRVAHESVPDPLPPVVESDGVSSENSSTGDESGPRDIQVPDAASTAGS